MGDIGGGPTPKIVAQYAKNFLCPWCNVRLESEHRYYRISKEYCTSFICTKNNATYETSHFKLNMWWRDAAVPSTVENIFLQSKSYKMIKGNSKYRITIPTNIASNFFDGEEVHCHITKNDNIIDFVTSRKYFDFEIPSEDFLIKKIEVVRLLK